MNLTGKWISKGKRIQGMSKVIRLFSSLICPANVRPGNLRACSSLNVHPNSLRLRHIHGRTTLYLYRASEEKFLLNCFPLRSFSSATLFSNISDRQLQYNKTFSSYSTVHSQYKKDQQNGASSLKSPESKGLNRFAILNRLDDQTKQRLTRRMTSLRHCLTAQNVKFKDKLKGESSTYAVRRIHRKIADKQEDIKTIPNLLTTLRMGSAPVLAYLVVNECFILAFGIFIVAGLTDVLDGYIARNFSNQRTALGTALDPLADKLLVSFLTVSLTSVGLVSIPLTVLILGRDAGLILGTFYVRYISLAPPRTFSRYFDVSHVTAKLYPSNISKVNTMLQLLFLASTLAAPVFDCVGHPLLQGLMYTTALTTFLSGADYVLTWRKRLKIVKK